MVKISTILLVEDNPHIMKINQEMLTIKGYDVLCAASAKECIQQLQWYNVNLIVMDIMLPDGNGVELCREIKERYKIPILFLSALGESKDIIEGLKAGGDDYLSKPYDLDVLEARIEARLRGNEENSRYYTYGALKLDLLWGCAYINSKDLLLSPREFSVLLLLTKNAESIVLTTQITDEIWHNNTEASTKALWTLISRLRKKIDSETTRLEISAIRGTGYMLEQV